MRLMQKLNTLFRATVHDSVSNRPDVIWRIEHPYGCISELFYHGIEGICMAACRQELLVVAAG